MGYLQRALAGVAIFVASIVLAFLAAAAVIEILELIL